MKLHVRIYTSLSLSLSSLSLPPSLSPSLSLSVGSYVLQYLGGKLYLAPFVTQALVQVRGYCQGNTVSVPNVMIVGYL